jgi:uncharacterized repeat protein (TIGR01451 family)
MLTDAPFRSRIATGVVAVLLSTSFVTLSAVGLAAPAANAAPANPTVDCSTDPAIFNTGINPATTGVLANNALDNNWQVSTTDLTTTFPAGFQPPASNVTYASAIVGNPIPRPASQPSGSGRWDVSPSPRANWITELGMTTQQGAGNTWYYRYDFTLDAAVEPSLFSVGLRLLSDNAASEIWVNGVPQSPSNASLPQGASSSAYNPYLYLGYTTARAIDVSLAEGWETGPNSIVVQVLSGAPWQGLLAWATSGITCGPNAIDDVLVAIGQNESIAPFSPASNDIEGTSALVASTTVLDQTTAVGGTFTVDSAGLVSFVAAPGFSGSASIDYEISDVAGLTARATITVPVTAVSPTASPDTATTDPGVTVEVELLANDAPGNSATPLDASSLALDALGSGGTVTDAGATLSVPGEGTYSVLPSGRVRFAPEATFRGAVTSEVGYSVSDVDGTETSSTLVITVTNPALTLTKTLTGNDDADDSTTVTEGDTLTYQLVATNSGDVVLTGVEITDELTADTMVCSVVHANATCMLSVTYVVTEADAVVGQVVNSAIASATSPGATRIDAPSATVETAVELSQQLPTLPDPGPVPSDPDGSASDLPAPDSELSELSSTGASESWLVGIAAAAALVLLGFVLLLAARARRTRAFD